MLWSFGSCPASVQPPPASDRNPPPKTDTPKPDVYKRQVIGVPAFAVIYRLFSQFISWQLRKKNLPETTAVYDRTEDMEKGV